MRPGFWVEMKEMDRKMKEIIYKKRLLHQSCRTTTSFLHIKDVNIF